MSAALGLDALLVALREAGLPVGVAEVARLRRVFALEPGFEDERRLRSVLRAVLVRTAEDRARFEPVFEAWVSRAGQEMVLREDSPPPLPPVPVKPPRRRSVWRVLALSALPCLLLIGTDEVRKSPLLPPVVEMPPQPVLESPPLTAPVSSPSPEPDLTSSYFPVGSILTPEEIRKRTFETWVPTLTVIPAEPTWKGWPGAVLGCLALMATIALWLNLRHQITPSEQATEPTKKGPPRVFLPPPQLTGPQLLEPREQESLIWGIGQFVSEEPTRRLDLPTTVRETARAAGVPRLLFHQARHSREVWLWIDDAAEDPSLFRIATEIEASLQSHGLPFEKALFRSVPDRLVNAAGETFAPNEVDERRDAALVAILTDGRILTRQYAADDRRVRLDALLRSLSHWPRLAFVDFSTEPGDLTAILAKHSLLKIAPSGLAAFLGSDEAARRKVEGAVSGDAIWAAACAVAPASVDEQRALDLRKRLGLATSPWALRSLRAEAPGPPGRLQWQPQDRARRVNWLAAAEAEGEGSLQNRALSYWEEVYDQELKNETWQDTPAHQHLSMERSLLSLWRDPETGTRELFRLYGGAFREPVERELRHLAPMDWGGPELLHFPWTWESIPAPERAMLQQMGLGGGMPPLTPRQPGRLWLGLGLCLGLAAWALGSAALSGWQEPEGRPTILHSPLRPPGAWEEIYLNLSKRLEVSVATRKAEDSQEAPAGSRVEVRWQQRNVPCVLVTDRKQEWNCGTIENPPRLPQPQWRRVVVLATKPGVPETEALAVDLLDSGSADQVVVTPDWEPYADVRDVISPSGAPILVVTSPDWRRLREALRFEGLRPVKQVWPTVTIVAGDPSTLLSGSTDCQNGQRLEEGGMTFVRVCPGTFTMGSTDIDPHAADEKPIHQVRLSEYWIGRTEVTNGQYRIDHPSHKGLATLPATNVSWYEAKTFCERRGWRLPTEAEWEYAASTGKSTSWHFGSDERQLAEHAWFDGNSDGAHPVATKNPNAWGLYDMHGNVWEWVEDWYGPYSAEPQTDPKGPTTGSDRVLRGSSFFNSPWFLRSAHRYRLQPSIQVGFNGFRCARDSRQP